MTAKFEVLKDPHISIEFNMVDDENMLHVLTKFDTEEVSVALTYEDAKDLRDYLDKYLKSIK